MESRRNVELSLLLLALILSVGAYVIVGLAADNEVPSGSAGYGATLAGLFLGAHLVLHWRAPQADPILLPGAALLNGLGLVMVRRLDYAEAAKIALVVFLAAYLAERKELLATATYRAGPFLLPEI